MEYYVNYNYSSNSNSLILSISIIIEHPQCREVIGHIFTAYNHQLLHVCHTNRKSNMIYLTHYTKTETLLSLNQQISRLIISHLLTANRREIQPLTSCSLCDILDATRSSAFSSSSCANSCLRQTLLQTAAYHNVRTIWKC